MKSKKINSFEEFVNEDSMQIMYAMSFTLKDLMEYNLITFKEDVTTDDVKEIFEYFKKAYMAGDSLTSDIKVKLSSDNIVFTLSSTNSLEQQAKTEFVNFTKDIIQDISKNTYAVIEDDERKIKKFIDKFYE